MSTVPKRRISAEEYLSSERRSPTKSEYFQGEIFAMSGASREHNLIVKNLVVALDGQLRDRPCEVYPSDLRVKVLPSGLYTYPDSSVVCGTPRFEDSFVDTLLNPTVLFEVLSPSTEAYDRGPKARNYRLIDSLKQLVLVSQSEPHVECHTRTADGTWALSEAAGTSGELPLESISVLLRLQEVYRGVEFSDQSFFPQFPR